jgi:hypothetical protein
VVILSAIKGKEVFMNSFHIFHTGDIHGNMDSLLRICAHIKGLRKKGVPLIFLDAGDLFGASSASVGLCRALEAAGLNALVLGNHEADLPKPMLSKALFGKKFEVLGGNVTIADSISCSGHIMVKPLPDLEVSITGVAAEGLSFGQSGDDNWTWSDGITYLNDNPRPRATDRLNIILSHMGLEKDISAARSCQWADLILGGHTHTETPQPIVEGNARVFHCGGYGRFVNHLIFTRIDSAEETGNIAEANQKNISDSVQRSICTFTVPGFRVQSELVDTYSLECSGNDLEMITSLAFRDMENSRVLLQVPEPVRGPKFKPNLFGAIAARAVSWVTGSDMAFVNATAVNPSFTSRFFTVRDIATILSFDDRIMVCNAPDHIISRIDERMVLDKYYFLHRSPAATRQSDHKNSIKIALPQYLSRGGMINGTAYDFMGKLPFRDSGFSLAGAMEKYMETFPDEIEAMLKEWLEVSNV